MNRQELKKEVSKDTVKKNTQKKRASSKLRRASCPNLSPSGITEKIQQREEDRKPHPSCQLPQQEQKQTLQSIQETNQEKEPEKMLENIIRNDNEEIQDKKYSKQDSEIENDILRRDFQQKAVISLEQKQKVIENFDEIPSERQCCIIPTKSVNQEKGQEIQALAEKTELSEEFEISERANDQKSEEDIFSDKSINSLEDSQKIGPRTKMSPLLKQSIGKNGKKEGIVRRMEIDLTENTARGSRMGLLSDRNQDLISRDTRAEEAQQTRKQIAKNIQIQDNEEERKKPDFDEEGSISPARLSLQVPVQNFSLNLKRPRANTQIRYIERGKFKIEGVKQPSKSCKKFNESAMQCEASLQVSEQTQIHDSSSCIEREPMKRISSRRASISTMSGASGKDKVSNFIRKFTKKWGRFPKTKIQFYGIGRMIGRGSFGKVHLGIHKLTGESVAIKSLAKHHQQKKVKQEIAVLKRMRHPGLVNLLETFETKGHILLVMELCAGGDLLSYVRRRRHLKQSVAKYIFYQVMRGIQYCHSKGIIHRDIKLENILLDARGKVKVCDFGVSREIAPEQKVKDKTGTPAYIAPEVIRGEGYSFPVDIWSAGVVLYAMLEGAVPFRGQDLHQLRKNVLNAKYSMSDKISKDAKDLLRRILVLDPKKRIDISEILVHRWLQDIDHEQYLFTPTELGLVKRLNQEESFFTEKTLKSEATVQEKSVILAPFNSEESKGAEIDPEDLFGPQLQFARKIRQRDRDYEITHCKELDNGVYHRFAYDSEQGVELGAGEVEEEIEYGGEKTPGVGLARQNTGIMITGRTG